MTFRSNLLFSTVAVTLVFAGPSFADSNLTPKTAIVASLEAPKDKNTESDTTVGIQSAALASPAPAVKKALGEKELNENKPTDKQADTIGETSPQTSPKPPVTTEIQPDLLKKRDTEQAPLNKAASAQHVADLELTLAIKETIKETSKTRNRLQRKDNQALASFYAERNYLPIWVKNNTLTADGNALIKRLAVAENDGLNKADYATIKLVGNEDLKSITTAEIQLSKALLHYARDAQAGRIIPSRVDRGFKLKPVYPDPSGVMIKLTTSADKVAALASYNPPHPGYKALRAELIKLRTAGSVEEHVNVPAGKTMSQGYRGSRVEILRVRLNVPVLAEEDAQLFDQTVKTAVRAFQSENNLIADGIIGPKTLRAINRVKSNRIPDIIANMEHWRWMDRDMGKLHVVANIPSFNVTVMKNNQNIHRTRVVVGKTKHKTPIFSDLMEFVVVNPYWNVPYSIASKELLPRIRSNPGFIRSKNYEILSGSRVVNPTSVNWNAKSFNRLRIRQRPGGNNALGHVKFLFPNDYSIYFHDTPSKSLFQRAARAFSHGCVRIYQPFEFGNVLMKHSKGWKKGRLKSFQGGKENWIRLKGKERIPVHITYFTAVSNDNGDISYKSDVYGHHARLKQALGLI